MDDERSKSYIGALPEGERERVAREIERLVRARFTDGSMTVHYETWLWIGDRR